jgi:dTDP-glucose 4,6-dehydratase
MAPKDGRVIPNFFTQALKNNPLTVYGDGSQTRSLCYVSDMVAGFMTLMESDETRPVNIGNSNEYKVLEIGEMINKLTGNDAGFTYKDLPENDPKLRRPDTTRAKEVLGWEAKINADEGLAKTLEYFKGLEA